jgi:ABC-2 type transport system permease protein
VNAFLYLALASGRNRFRTIAGRVRTPRYAAALVVGALYLWFFLLRPMSSPDAAPSILGRPTEMIVTVLAVLTLMGSWVFGADATALAFKQAEVSFLFPAPLSRRALIGYKLFRAQIAVLFNALIWVFVLSRGGSELHPLLRAISLWLLFSTMNLHRLGAALVRSSWREHGDVGAKKQRWSIALFIAVGIAIVASLVEHRSALTAGAGPGAFFTNLGIALSDSPASWALYPFHVVVAPTFAQTAAAWQRLIVPGLIVLAAHAWWVIRVDTAFEEAAMDASAERAKRLETMRARRSMTSMAAPRKATATIALASSGHPALAILWKNTLCLRRTAQLRLFIGPVAMSLVLGSALAENGGDIASVTATSALAFAGLLLIFGGRLIRNDLRQDMLHLTLLKTLPIAPGQLMMAEVASSALPMAALQMTLLLIAYVASAITDFALVDPTVRLGALIAAPLAVLVLNGALMTIQNGTAVLFRTWIRLGPVVSTGVEALGQNVLATMANLVSLAIGLILPAMAGIFTLGALGGPGVLAIALSIAAGSIVLAAETYFVLRLLGGSLSRVEPWSAVET